MTTSEQRERFFLNIVTYSSSTTSQDRYECIILFCDRHTFKEVY